MSCRPVKVHWIVYAVKVLWIVYALWPLGRTCLYMKIIIDVLEETCRQLVEVHERNDDILEENKQLREEISLLGN
ncbi:unnamed protein product [Haemonchus placei]|uniref:BZIP transcription factor n=1 Tax=Haemonchus placei TaxID=6290 RepID=A0A0N4WRB2_HAEPC|nr:unnamed protein product [Haemonchus placei]